MASITPSVAPGIYLGEKEVSFTFSPDIVSVAMTKNAAPPSVSKYIAYDTLTPPNPFLAVTEDGRGRVVYDGGFPKFYNSSNYGAPANFSELTPAGKYLYNALRWVANPEKVAAGNKKVLILGDTFINTNYAVKSTSPDGFKTTVTNVCTLAGFIPTIMDLSDFPGERLDISGVDLDQYTCVVLFSSAYPPEPRITPKCVSEMVLYRENGNGIVMITDHGPDLASIEDVKNKDAAFFKTANAIAYNFGAYFTGNFNRTPVNVGFVRKNYGDHPLYAGLTDEENIPAGGSESKVVVTTAQPIVPGNVGSHVTNLNGTNTFNFLVTLQDGSTQTFRFQYQIQKNEFVFFKSVNPETGQQESNTKTYTDVLGRPNLNLGLDTSVVGPMQGLIYKGTKQVGETYYSGGVQKVHWYCGVPESLPVTDGDSITVKINSPVVKEMSISVERPDVSAMENLSVMKAKRISTAKTVFGVTGIVGVVSKLHDAIRASLPASLKKQKLTVAETLAFLRNAVQNKVPLVEGLVIPIYSTATLADTAATSTPSHPPGTYFIAAETGEVYIRVDGNVVKDHYISPSDLFTVGTILKSSIDGFQYRVNETKPLTKI